MVALNAVHPLKICFYFSAAIEADDEIEPDDLNEEKEHLNTRLVFEIIDYGKHMNSK